MTPTPLTGGVDYRKPTHHTCPASDDPHPCEVVNRAVSVRAAYAFGDWPPRPSQASDCYWCLGSGRSPLANVVCRACDGRGWVIR